MLAASPMALEKEFSSITTTTRSGRRIGLTTMPFDESIDVVVRDRLIVCVIGADALAAWSAPAALEALSACEPTGRVAVKSLTWPLGWSGAAPSGAPLSKKLT